MIQECSLKPVWSSADASGIMAKRMDRGTGGMNPEAWVLDPSNWGFVMDVWGGFDVEDFTADAQNFPISARALPMGELGFAVDKEEAPPQPEPMDTAAWNFDADHWGFATGWTERNIGDI